jgi:hypothetical protein
LHMTGCWCLIGASLLNAPAIYFAIVFRYRSSTLLRAQGVRRRNFRLDLMLGSW